MSQLKSQVYAYDAQAPLVQQRSQFLQRQPDAVRRWCAGQIYRERLSVDHDQKLYGNVTDLTVNSNVFGMDNRLVTTLAASSLQFNVRQEDNSSITTPSTS